MLLAILLSLMFLNSLPATILLIDLTTCSPKSIELAQFLVTMIPK